MEKVLKQITAFLFPPVDPVPATTPLPSEAEELASLKRRIRAAESRFAFVSEDSEVTAAIYELTALEARYDLLMRCARASAGQTG